MSFRVPSEQVNLMVIPHGFIAAKNSSDDVMC